MPRRRRTGVDPPLAATPIASTDAPRITTDTRMAVAPPPSATILPSPRPVPGSKAVQAAQRSRAVSFDRPYQWPGDGEFFRFEYPFVSWLESRMRKRASAPEIATVAQVFE